MTNGFDIPISEYHKLSANGSGDVRLILKSKYQYYARKVLKQSIADVKTPAKILGDVVHCMVLEPWRFDEQYVVLPPRVKSDPNDKRTVIREPEYQRATDAARAVNHSQIARQCLFEDDEFLIERTFVGNDKETSLDVKCRPDILREDRIVDLKTTQDASPAAFEKLCAKFGYHIQAAFYQMVIESIRGKSLPFYFVCVETRWPYNCAVYRLNDVAISYGRSEVRKGLDLISHCQNNDDWQDDWTKDVQLLSLPDWAYFSEEQDEELVGFDL